MTYSFRDFTCRILQHEKIEPQTIEGSCFSQETPDSRIFPENMTGVTFLRCNLDNCHIPAGNTVEGGSQRRFKVQNDREDWEIDADNNPVRPVNWKALTKQGLPVPKPEDLPKKMRRAE